jgi:hypothetical protein
MTEILHINNDTTVTLTALTDTTASTPLNSATVTFDLVDTVTGTQVTGMTFPATMTYVATTSGDYTLVLEQSLDLTTGNKYTGTITASSGTLDAKWDIDFVAQKRTF